MVRFLSLAVLLALVAGGAVFFSRYEIRGLDQLDLRPRGTAGSTSRLAARPAGEAAATSEEGPRGLQRRWIRIAAFHFGPVDRVKMGKQHVLGSIVEVIRDFDIVAIQDIRDETHGPLLDLLELVNADGRAYDFVTSADVGRKPLPYYAAYLYDKQTIEVDPSTVYRITVPGGRFRWAPLVGGFRAKGPAPALAFTFTLISVQVDDSHALGELDLLDDVYRAVRYDKRGEDDVIMLGNFAADWKHLGPLKAWPQLRSATGELPTTTRGTRSVDHILFDTAATVEFTGRAGVIDLMRRFDLSMPQALEISDHLPVWAEFSVFEGGEPMYGMIGR